MKFAAASIVLLLVGCAPSQEAAPQQSGLQGTVTVFAAASLTGAFEHLAERFEQQNPGVEVVFSFGGSSGLATQIAEGAPADIFAAASPATMQSSGVTESTVFATNVLQIAVPAGNPAKVTGLHDFANPQLAIAVCAVEVPCGAATQKLFAEAGITPSIDTFEEDVKAVLTRIELDEVDAGLVYVTDVAAAGDAVEGIAVESSAVDYPIAAITDTDAALAFFAFVLSDEGQAVLSAAGFGAA